MKNELKTAGLCRKMTTVETDRIRNKESENLTDHTVYKTLEINAAYSKTRNLVCTCMTDTAWNIRSSWPTHPSILLESAYEQ